MSDTTALTGTEQIQFKGGLKKESFWRYFRMHTWLYILLVPGVVYLFIFNYIPIYGIIIAFKDFSSS